MSAEEDGPFGVEVSYVDTENEDNDDSEATIPATEIMMHVHEDTPATVRYVSGAVILDDATPDYSTSSGSTNNTHDEVGSRIDLLTLVRY
ncbi:unnamed protein product [Gongylonema pulchrum]|uniref:Uncharacterized protein n=1 Tax=Gongylonema pulchrum TaxID=637853 RepID=A0A183DE60_9BILA|nr:unnamed protein product [Gongylonema pulchrum]